MIVLYVEYHYIILSISFFLFLYSFFHSVIQKDTYDPWGKGYGNADRLADGRVKPRPNALEKDKKKVKNAHIF